ncbi:MAG: U32 family peptidase C-terminal domain-containing protein, partial [Lachnospiraceae bacterium]|nr:U32 family peptidase C-terminal domain-containing protein [Lachnospiraceae bacterium]
AIDDYYEDPEKYKNRLDFYREEISKCTYREYTTGFFFGKPDETTQIYDESTYVKEWIYLGIIGEEKREINGDVYYKLEQKNKFSVGDEVEIMKPSGETIIAAVKDMIDEEGNHIESCPHPKQIFYADFGVSLNAYDMIRFHP